VLKTTPVTELRAHLASFLGRLDDGPVVVLSRSRPAAVLVKPEVFEGMLCIVSGRVSVTVGQALGKALPPGHLRRVVERWSASPSLSEKPFKDQH